jgi:nucleoside-diphosphate-sugar epimerase
MLSVVVTALVGLAGQSRGVQPTRAGHVRAAEASSSPPLLIVGAGVLGRLAAAEWRELHGGGCKVVGATRSSDAEREAAMRAEGITPRLVADVAAECEAGTRWPYVLFCAAPGGNDDYAGAVKDALRLWDSGCGGSFVFTSSAGVYAESAGGIVTEASPVADTPRTAKLLDAESAVIEAGGRVVRLAGLYLEERGAHNFWLTRSEVAQRADGLINLVHYRDAANAAVAALLRGAPGAVYLAADDRPLSREQICREACRAPRFRERTVPSFTGTDSAIGKVCDSSATRKAIGWSPLYSTFGAFVDSLIEAEQ